MSVDDSQMSPVKLSFLKNDLRGNPLTDKLTNSTCLDDTTAHEMPYGSVPLGRVK